MKVTRTTFTLIWMFISVTVIAQQTNFPIKIEPRDCEFNNLILEQSNLEAEKDSTLILIARPGVKDTLKNISKRRLYTAWAYLVEYSKLRQNDSIVIAETTNDNKLYYGGIEIYANGKLLNTITTHPNALLSLGSCSHPDTEDDKSRARQALLYPWLYKKNKK